MTKLYYQPPTDKQFNELKKKAIKIWQTYDNAPYLYMLFVLFMWLPLQIAFRFFLEIEVVGQ